MRDQQTANEKLGLRSLILALVAAVALSGCAVRPVTPELAQFVPEGGYRWHPEVVLPDNDPQTLLVLTFSGGGTRAAAFAFGVLEELRRTPVAAPGGTHTMLSEIDLITGTSGGSFTALSYALYGERMFEFYEHAFLKRDVEGDLLRRLFNPVTWPDMLSQGFGRSELAAQFYDEILFHDATYGDLAKKATPVAIVGSTDVTTGSRIDFSQSEFDIICANLSEFRLSRAAAASSAVPVIFTPVTLDNRGGKCGYHPARWIVEMAKAPENLFLGNRADLRLQRALLLENSAERPYLHLVDGGLADNLALLGVVDALQAAMLNQGARNRMELGKIRRIAIVIVNARSAPSFDFDKVPNGPGPLALLAQAISVPMDRFSTASIAALQDMITQWQLRTKLEQDALQLGQRFNAAADLPQITFTVVDVSFEAVANPVLRDYLQNLPTSFALSEEAVDRLRASGAQVLRDSPGFRNFVDSLAQPR